MKKIALLIGLLFATPALAADNAVVVTPGVGVTMKSKDIGSGVQAMQPILSDASGNALLTTSGADAVSNTLTGIPAYSRTLFFNGTTWDRWQGAVTATLGAETTKVIGTVRVASGGIASGAVAAGALAAGAGVDGWDLTQGAIADAAATAGSAGSVSAKLRLMTTQLSTINTTLGTPLQAGGSIGNTTFAATQGTAANLNATIVGTGTLAVQLTGATNNINNIAGTITLPTLASTSTKQSDGSQKTQIVDGSGNVIASTSNNLNVQCANCSGSGVSTGDQATFTAGASLFAGGGGFFQTTATSNPLTNGQQGMFQVTAQRAMFSNLRNASGAELGVAAAPLQVSLANTGSNGTAVAVSLTSTTVTGSVAVTAASGAFASGSMAAGSQVDLLTMRGTKNAGTAAANSILAGLVYNATPLTATDGQGLSLQGDVNGYLNVNVKSATGPAQGSTTSGQTGSLVMGAVTTASPTYTTAQTSPLSLDTAGSLRVAIISGAGSGGTAIADGATFTEATTSFTPVGGEYVSGGGANCTTGKGCTWQMTIDRMGYVNVGKINGVVPLMGNGTTGTGSQRVTLASDGTAISTAGFMSVKIDQTTPGTTNLVSIGTNGTVNPTTAANWAIGATGSAVPANAQLTGGTDGTNTRAIATDASGNQKVINGGSNYETVAASQTAQAMGATGATGDYLSHCVIYPVTTAAGAVTVFDNTNAAGTNVITFTSGTLSNLAPIPLPVGAVSTAGAWKVTTGANVTVTCYGKFT